MVGVGIPSSRLESCHEAIESGEILLLVDVPKDRVEELEERIKKLHAEAKIEGVDPMVPAFP